MTNEKDFIENDKDFDPNEFHQSLYEFIYYNDRCKNSELNKALAHNYDRKLERYLRRKMNYRQLKRSLNDLLKKNHIKALSVRNFGEKKDLPEIFTVNLDFIHLYPNIKKK